MTDYSIITDNIEAIKDMAAKGDADAQNKLGICYKLGLANFDKDFREAAKWFTKAAIQGFPKAQYNLGCCYLNGQGVTQNSEFAVEWFIKAADQGFAAAQYELGFLYENGKCIKRNNKKAFELYSRAADMEYIPAFVNMGYCYENGIGTSQSYLEAESYYSKAAEKGNEYAKKALERIKEKVEDEKFYKSINFSTRQKFGNESYARLIPFGKNYIVKRKGLWGIVDRNNTHVLPLEYTRVHWFDRDYAGIQKNKLWGLVNNKGTITIDPQYELLQYDSQRQACNVECGEEGFLVDVNNNIIMRVPGKNVRFSGDKFMVCSKEEWQLYNMDGTPFSKVHSRISSEYKGYYMAYDDEKRTLIKKDGSETKLPTFETGVFSGSITQFRFNNKYGIIDDNANIVVPNKYDYIILGSGVIAVNEGHESKDHDRYFYVIPNGGKWFFLNYDIKEITPYKYDRIAHEYSKDGEVFFAERDGYWYQIKPEGEQLFAKTESEYKKKKENINKERQKKDHGWGKFEILEDVRYKKEGRKLFVRSYDGFYIRKYYLTPYLPKEANMKWHYVIGEYFVNKYGQEMSDPHAFKLPKRKKPRYIFRLNPSLMKLTDKEMIDIFVGLIKPFGFEQRDIINLYAIYKTHRKRAVLCDWLLRKYKRKKSVKFEFDVLVSMSVEIDTWLKKQKI